jgi:hypothetical protein
LGVASFIFPDRITGRPIKDGILFSLQRDAYSEKTMAIAYRQSALDNSFPVTGPQPGTDFTFSWK